jgi:hypothetical protein
VNRKAHSSATWEDMTGGASADVISASYSERLSMGIEDVVDTWDATEPCPSARHVSAEWIEILLH